MTSGEYIEKFIGIYRANTTDDRFIGLTPRIPYTDMLELIVEAIKCNLQDIISYGPNSDHYVEFGSVMETARCSFTIQEGNSTWNFELWDFELTRYVSDVIHKPYAIRIVLSLHSIKFRLEYGINDDTNINNAIRVENLLNDVVKRLKCSLTSEEQVVFMLSKIGNIIDFLQVNK